MSDDLPKLPEPLEKIIDKVLAYKPKAAKAKAAKKKAKKRRAGKRTTPLPAVQDHP